MHRQRLFLVRALGLAGSVMIGVTTAGCASSGGYGEAAFAAPSPGMTPPGMAAATPAQEPSSVALPTQPAATAPARPPASAAPSLAKSADDKSPRLDSAALPMLIYEAELGVQVPRESFATSIERAIDVAESLCGYLLSRSDTGVRLRIPSRSFRSALKELDQLGSITRRSVTAQDVSEQFHDLEVRLKNLESVRNRLEQFLARATNVGEALTVGKELENVTRQIDELKGRMQFLKTRAAYSLVSVAFEPKPADVVAKDPPGPPPPPPARPAKLPVEWLRQVGLDGLLRLD
jgi:hypothetical protein